jgi:hypothetical protein
MENAIDLESLGSEFQFVELRRRLEKFIWQHPQIEVIRLTSAIVDLQRRLARQDRKFCQFAEANGRAKAEQEAQFEGLPAAIGDIAKKQRNERKKVSGLQEAREKVQRHIS